MVSLTVGGPGAQQQPAPRPLRQCKAHPAPARSRGSPRARAAPSRLRPSPSRPRSTTSRWTRSSPTRRATSSAGLTKDDFEVLEDGKPQKVELFTEIDIPVEKPERFLYSQRVIPPDTKTNREPFQGRLYIIVLDDLHTNALRSALVKRAAKQFIDRNFGANDLAAMVTTSGMDNAAQEFTNDTRLLNRAVDKFIGQKLRSRTLERLDEYNRQRSTAQPSSDGNSSSNTQQKILDPLDFERGFKARQTLTTLKNLANYLSGVRGRRKALLFFSEGIDYPIYDLFDSRSASDVLYETREAITAAARSNVNFYTIDPQGLIGLPGDAIDITSVPEDNNLRLNTQGMMDEVRLAQDSLRTLAEETGGIAMVNQNDFAKGFDNIVRANSKYYVLGYYPSADQKRDGRFHKIAVRTKRPGLRVDGAQGLRLAEGQGAPRNARRAATRRRRTALKETLNSPLQQSGVGLTVAAAAFKGSAPNNSIALAIEIDPTRMTFKEDKGLFINKLELSFFPVDEKGKPLKGTTSELDLKLKPNTYQMIQAFGFRVNPRIDLPPGRYQVRIGARESGAGEVGSVFYDIEVPDFAKEKLTMSDVLLTAATSKLVLTPLPDKQVEGVLPLPATARRDFVKGDTLALFAEVYDNLPPLPAHKIDITTKLITEDGREVFKTTEERDSKELQGIEGRRLRPRAADPARRRRAGPLSAADRSGGALEGRQSGGEGTADSRPSGPPGSGAAGGAPPSGAQPSAAPGTEAGARRPPHRSQADRSSDRATAADRNLGKSVRRACHLAWQACCATRRHGRAACCSSRSSATRASCDSTPGSRCSDSARSRCSRSSRGA